MGWGGCISQANDTSTHIYIRVARHCSSASTNLDSDDEKLLDTIAPGTPDMSTMKGYTADEQEVMQSLQTPAPESTTPPDHYYREDPVSDTRVHWRRRIVDVSSDEKSKEELEDGVPKFMRDYSAQESHKKFSLNDFYNLLEVRCSHVWIFKLWTIMWFCNHSENPRTKTALQLMYWCRISHPPR